MAIVRRRSPKCAPVRASATMTPPCSAGLCPEADRNPNFGEYPPALQTGSRSLLRQGQLSSTVDAVGQVDRRPEVAGPERVAAAPLLCPAALDLSSSVHRKRARSREPFLVAGVLEQR